MKELAKFIEWYKNLGGSIFQIDFDDLRLTKFSDYD